MKTIPLTQGKVALVDDGDFEIVNKYNWFFSPTGTGYAHHTVYMGYKKSPTAIQMHRLIMAPPEGMFVDHINHDTLDNRRQNLRLCTRTENLRNQKGYKRRVNLELEGIKGVGKTKWGGYVATIYRDGKNRSLGTYKTIPEAAEAYNKAAREHHGAFAVLNEVT